MAFHDDSIHSKRLLRIRRPCPECHETLRPTGYLKHRSIAGESWWGIEYECPKEHETFVISDEERRDLIDSIVREAGKE